MQKQNKNGFKFYASKDQHHFPYLSFMNQIPQQINYLNSNIDTQEKNPGKSFEIFKTKIIQKDRQKQKEQVKRYDRGGNCVASNTSKLFIKILNKRLSKFPIIENYLNYYEIYSQKQNILLIPLCLYSFLKQYQLNYQKRFLSQLQVAQKKLLSSQQKFNTKAIYLDIINQLKQHIECSLQNSKAKYKDCVEAKKQFHLKNISIYNKISEIIKKVQLLSQNLTKKCKQKQNYQSKINSQINQKNKLNQNEMITHVKIEEQQANYNQYQNPQNIQQSSIKILEKYNLENLQSPLQSLYERKQRQYQKAMDKVYSVILNQNPLRQLFQIFKSNIKQILLESVNYCYRRNINSRVKKNEKMIKDVYEKLQSIVIDTLKLNQDQSQIGIKGWEFIISFFTLKISGDKKFDIYEQFKENIKRKIKYFNLIQSSDSKNQKQSFDKEYYNYSLRMLEASYEKQKNMRNQTQNNKNLYQQMKQWLTGYFYHNSLNKLLIENPKTTAQQQINKSLNSNFNFYHNAQISNQNNQKMNYIHTFPNLTSQVKEQEMIPEKSSKIFHGQNKGIHPYIKEKQQNTLRQLIQKFFQLQKQNYQGVI